MLHQTLLRIWDCLFREGSTVLLRVALAMVAENRTKILNCVDFTELVTVFKVMTCDSHATNCHKFMKVCRKNGNLYISRLFVARDIKIIFTLTYIISHNFFYFPNILPHCHKFMKVCRKNGILHIRLLFVAKDMNIIFTLTGLRNRNL